MAKYKFLVVFVGSPKVNVQLSGDLVPSIKKFETKILDHLSLLVIPTEFGE